MTKYRFLVRLTADRSKLIEFLCRVHQKFVQSTRNFVPVDQQTFCPYASKDFFLQLLIKWNFQHICKQPLVTLLTKSPLLPKYSHLVQQHHVSLTYWLVQVRRSSYATKQFRFNLISPWIFNFSHRILSKHPLEIYTRLKQVDSTSWMRFASPPRRAVRRRPRLAWATDINSFVIVVIPSSVSSLLSL